MNVLIAGTALILVQLCTALVMAGIFHATPTERCTRYWALSAFCVAVGVLVSVLNGGAPRYAVLVIGNNLLMLGLVLQWQGIRTFYRRPVGAAGWLLGAAFFLLYGWLLLRHASVPQRALLGSLSITGMLLLNLNEVRRGASRHPSFASMLTLAALGLLLGCYCVRITGVLLRPAAFLPDSDSLLSLAATYLGPAAGGLLLSSGLMLLYFERLVAEKHRLAMYDELSGTLNRRALGAAGEREIRLASRLGLPVTVAFVDIDQFKQINDTGGHDAGDRAIAEMARALGENCRAVDLLGRYGGDEFCLIFPGIDRAGAETVGERLVQSIRRRDFGDIGKVTISIGLAVRAGSGDDRSWEAMVQRADAELYKAKQNGRDRISLAAG